MYEESESRHSLYIFPIGFLQVPALFFSILILLIYLDDQLSLGIQQA